MRDPQHAGLLVRQRVGDELDQQVKVVARLAPGAYDRGQHAPLGAELGVFIDACEWIKNKLSAAYRRKKNGTIFLAERWQGEASGHASGEDP